MTLKTNKLILALVLFIPAITHALQSDLKKPFAVESDQAVFYKKQGIAIFTGHVSADQGSSHTTGSKLVINLNKIDNKINSAVITGNPATYKTDLKKYNTHLNARADIIKYYPGRTLITLEKHAKVTRSGDSISSNRITFNIKTETVMTKNAKKKNSQTTIIIHPNDIR